MTETLAAYRRAAGRMGVALPAALEELLRDAAVSALAAEGAIAEVAWSEPVPLAEMADHVFEPGPKGGSERILLFAGESEYPLGLVTARPSGCGGDR